MPAACHPPFARPPRNLGEGGLEMRSPRFLNQNSPQWALGDGREEEVNVPLLIIALVLRGYRLNNSSCQPIGYVVSILDDSRAGRHNWSPPPLPPKSVFSIVKIKGPGRPF